MTIDQVFQNASQHHRAGQLAEAERLYRAILNEQPDHAEAMHRLGIVANQTARYREAVDWLSKAIARQPMAETHADLAVALIFLNQSDEAISHLRQAIEMKPGLAGAHGNLGTLLQKAGQFDAAIKSFQQAISLEPANPQFHFNLGNALLESKNYPAAIDAFNAALKLKPDYAAVLVNLGSAYHSLAQSNELAKAQHLEIAVRVLRQAIRIDPHLPQAFFNLGKILYELGRFEEAAETYRQALRLQPRWAELHYNLSIALRADGDTHGAIAEARQALMEQPGFTEARQALAQALQDAGEVDESLELFKALAAEQPDNPRALNSYANILRSVGQYEQAMDYFQRAVRADPSDHLWACNYVFALQFQCDDPQLILEANRKWDRDYSQRFRDEAIALAKDRHLDQPSEQRLRIGYVSPHFGRHVQALFMTALLPHHDHEQVEVYLYSTAPTDDPVTERIKTYADVWRNVSLLNDAAVAQQISADKIDILVDLTMHMAGCRPLIFARKPAPVQVAWLAYPGTTGMWSMDYRLTDPHLDPPLDHRRFENRYTEKSIHLPDSFWCYSPHVVAQVEGDVLPEPGELPAKQNGLLTFGCLNEFAKINVATIQRWAQLMQRVEKSRLHLLAPKGKCREWVVEIFGSTGVDSQRIEFINRQRRSAYLAEYQRIDLCVDTMPSNGHTTSLDAFWMGVPVLTRIGNVVVSRAGLSQLTNLQVDGFVAESDEQFVEQGVRCASDLDGLAEIRRTLRDRMEASALMDGKRFARGIEEAFRKM